SIVPLRMRQPGTLPPTPNRSPRGSSKLPLTNRLNGCGAGAGGPNSGSTCSTAVTPPNWQPALRVTAVGEATGKVTMGKVTVFMPGATTTVAGTRAVVGTLLASVTITPPAPAGWPRITWPRVSRPPGTGF